MQRHGLIWDELKREGRGSVFFQEFTVHCCFTYDHEVSHTQAQKCLWCVAETNVLYHLLQGRLGCGMLLQKTKQRMRQLLVTLFPST